MAYRSPDGEEGYPGTCDCSALYEVTGQSTLRLTLEAHSDRTTLANLCHHPYFNFTAHSDIFDHVLELAAHTYPPSDTELIPTGVQQPVTGTPFDFTTPRPVGALRSDPGFNNNYCLASAPGTDVRFAARLRAPDGPSMESGRPRRACTSTAATSSSAA